MSARHHERHTELYAWDLLWSIAKRYYDGLPMPSDVWNGIDRTDRRSANQIIDDLINKCRGR